MLPMSVRRDAAPGMRCYNLGGHPISRFSFNHGPSWETLVGGNGAQKCDDSVGTVDWYTAICAHRRSLAKCSLDSAYNSGQQSNRISLTLDETLYEYGIMFVGETKPHVLQWTENCNLIGFYSSFHADPIEKKCNRKESAEGEIELSLVQSWIRRSEIIDSRGWL
jgi:hypothetical protein